jgi:hypothetical protein
MKGSFWQSLVAVLAGNAIYLFVERFLPPRAVVSSLRCLFLVIGGPQTGIGWPRPPFPSASPFGARLFLKNATMRE